MRYQIRFFIGLAAVFGLAGGAAGQTKLSSGLSVSHQLIDFVVSPAGDRMIYRAGPKGPSFPHVESRLYSVPSGGGTVTPLTGGLPASAGVADYAFSADGQHVIVRTDIDGPGVYSLFRTPPTGGSFQRISSAAAPLPRVWGRPYPKEPGYGSFAARERGLLIANNSQRVFYLAEKGTTGVLHLFVVPISGGFSPTQLSSDLGQGGVVPDSVRLTSDSQKVVYVSDHVTSGVFHLYSGPAHLPVPTQLSTTPLMDLRGGPRSRFGKYPLAEVSPNGQWVVFSACGTDPALWQMFAVPMAGGTVRRLHGNLPAGSVGVGENVQFSADGRYAYFSAGQTNRTHYDLVVADLQLGTTSIISPAPTELPWRVAVTASPARIQFWNHKVITPLQSYSAAANGTGRVPLFDGSFEVAKVDAANQTWLGLQVNRLQSTIVLIRAPLAGGTVQQFTLTGFTGAYDFQPVPKRNALMFIGKSATGTALHQLDMTTSRLFMLSLSNQGPRGVLDNEQQLFFSRDGDRIFFIGDDNGVMQLYSSAAVNASTAADGIWLEVK